MGASHHFLQRTDPSLPSTSTRASTSKASSRAASRSAILPPARLSLQRHAPDENARLAEWRDYGACWWDNDTAFMAFGPVLRACWSADS
jgi:hypothetical protein